MNEFFKITKIRLVNFHNVGTTTLELPDGGHLFLLGDNASGKTTVLDAVHFVLTGGHSMEFNSAARIAGAKNSGGRTVQGIVMRYNIETRGPMRPDGGITYAGLEIEGRNGKPISICVGVSCRSMDEEYKSWGILFDGPVAQAPLCEKAENGETRVLPPEALKDKMKGLGQFYGRIGAYTDALAERFFGGRDTYADVCQLLSTGKAYREIASRAGDYDKLFRSLLQEPDKEVFEKLIRDLKTLEESKQELEALRQRAKYVQEIVTVRDAVRDARLDELCARWQNATLQLREYEEAGRQLHQLRDAEAARLEDLKENERRLDDEEKRQNLRLSELQRRDTQNLVAKEKEAKLVVEEKRHAGLAARQKQMVCQSKMDEAAEVLAAAKESLVKHLARGSAEVQKLGKPLAFSTSGLVVAYDDAARAELPEEEVFKLSYQTHLNRVEEEATSLLRKIQSAETRLETLKTDAEAKRQEIAAKKAQEEAVPVVAGFLEARAALRQSMVHAEPLYEGLVPASILRPRDLAMLEEIIGDDILATWIVKKEQADEARKILFGAYPAQSLAVADEDDDTACDWLGRFFNLEESKPDAILVLRQQIAAKAGPHAEVFFGQSVLHFRNREHPARQEEPRLIGSEARREQIRREIRALEKELETQERKIREQEKTHDALVKDRDSLAAFRTFLRVEQESLPREANEVKTRRSGAEIARNDFVNAHANVVQCEEDEANAKAKWQDIQFMMRKADLDEAFAEKIKELEKKVEKSRKDHNECVGEVRSCEDKIKGLDGKWQDNAKTYSEVAAKRDAETGKLAAYFAGGENGAKTLDESVVLRCADRKGNRAALAEWEQARHDAAVDGVRSIKDKIAQNEGVAFGFDYAEDANVLTDRRGRTIDVVRQEGEKQVKDQEAVINDNTRHVFKQIVMDELISNLQTSVRRLEEMTSRIGKLLKNRAFGNNRYAFAISPNEGFENMVRIVRNYRSFDPAETEEELRHFLEANQDQLMNTEVGVIPEMLDYRNWFRYELKILMADSEGKIIDRRVKSMGSGGEQAVPNYLLILMIANFLYDRERIHLPVLIFDEAFYGIDAGRRDQILAFADDLGLQLFVASPDQDGVKKEIPLSTSVLVIKDKNFDVHLYPYHWKTMRQGDLLEQNKKEPDAGFEKETE